MPEMSQQQRDMLAAYKDWDCANGVIEEALMEWFGIPLQMAESLASAIQARLAHKKLVVANVNQIRYSEGGQ